MGITRMRFIPLVQIPINLKFFLAKFIARIHFQCHILMISDCISLLQYEIMGTRTDLLKITSEPYCRGNPKSQLTNDLVFGTKDIPDIYRIISLFLERFKSFLVKYLRCIDCFEAGGRKTHGRRGNSSKGALGPFKERRHD